MTRPRRHHMRRGAEAIEAAIALPILLIVLFSGFEYSWALVRAIQLDHAARLGAREAALSGATAADVQNRVAGSLTGLGITGATISVDPPQPESVAAGAQITVTVEVPYSNVGLLGLDRLMPLPSALEGRAAMVREPDS